MLLCAWVSSLKLSWNAACFGFLCEKIPSSPGIIRDNDRNWASFFCVDGCSVYCHDSPHDFQNCSDFLVSWMVRFLDGVRVFHGTTIIAIIPQACNVQVKFSSHDLAPSDYPLTSPDLFLYARFIKLHFSCAYVLSILHSQVTSVLYTRSESCIFMQECIFTFHNALAIIDIVIRNLNQEP